MQRVEPFRPTRSKGQCFLKDPRFIARIVEAVRPEPGETLLEIGAGEGQLTLPMIEAGGRVVAVETDPRLAAKLSAGINDKLELVRADALKLDFAALLDERGLARVRAYGNLPYSVAAPILLRVLSHADRFDSLVFMFQKEVADRLTAPPSTKDYSVLSVVAQHASRVEALFKVPPEAFRPRPRVMSAVVRFDLRHNEAPAFGDEATFRAVVKGLMAHRRKTIANNIKHLGAKPLSRDAILGALATLGIDPVRRAETLSVEDFAAISRICASRS